MKIKITVPTSLNDLTLRQYQRWNKIYNNEDFNDFQKQKLIEIFCNVDLRSVLMLKISDIDRICEQILNVLNSEAKFKNTFTMNGVDYGFIPKLSEMTFGEYIDLDNYLSDWDNMNKAMSVLFRPIRVKRKNKYIIEDYEGSDKYDLTHMPLDIVFGSMVFFWNLKEELQKHILNYLVENPALNITQQTKDLMINGVGINQSMDLPTVTL